LADKKLIVYFGDKMQNIFKAIYCIYGTRPVETAYSDTIFISENAETAINTAKRLCPNDWELKNVYRILLLRIDEKAQEVKIYPKPN